MPEIIEAEITKQKLTLALQGKRILDFWCDWPKGLISQERSIKRTREFLKDKKIEDITRKGKAVVLELEGGNILALHQRMSGHVKLLDKRTCAAKSYKDDKHMRFVFELSDGKGFSLRDPRKFGTVWCGKREWFLKQPYVEKLGYDALSITENVFVSLMAQSSASVKSFLLSQNKIAGLGNIACDEILWHAKVSPKKTANTINREEARDIYAALRRTLADVLRYGGTSMSDWRHPDGEKGQYQDFFKIYSRDECSRCNVSIVKTSLVGRGTYSCQACQR